MCNVVICSNTGHPKEGCAVIIRKGYIVSKLPYLPAYKTLLLLNRNAKITQYIRITFFIYYFLIAFFFLSL